jgi:hypothetical protein
MPTNIPFALHDWTLVSISYDWETSGAVFHLQGPDGERELVALKATNLSVPHSAPWGSSVSINQIEGSTVDESGNLTVKIEMQSGDVISLQAASIELR